MKMDKIANSKNDEYYTPLYAIKPILKYLKLKNYKKIWCPFDTENSFYVKEFIKNNYNVVYTHIENNQDFFKLNIPDCDIIISNPPYSLRTEILEYLFSLNIPFAMLLGIVGLFESKKRFSLFKNNNFEILYFDKRIAFFKDYVEKKPSINPPFSTVYICNNLLPDKICFEKINKKEY